MYDFGLIADSFKTPFFGFATFSASSSPSAFSHCFTRGSELLMFMPPPGWKWQPTRVQQVVLHRQNSREHYCWWVTLYIRGLLFCHQNIFSSPETIAALKHSKQLQTLCGTYSHLLLELPYHLHIQQIASLSWGYVLGFFYVLFYMHPLASTVLFVLILHNVFKCMVRMQDIGFYSQKAGCYFHSHACIQKALIPDNRLVPSS